MTSLTLRLQAEGLPKGGVGIPELVRVSHCHPFLRLTYAERRMASLALKTAAYRAVIPEGVDARHLGSRPHGRPRRRWRRFCRIDRYCH